jgi:hypothetical protein
MGSQFCEFLNVRDNVWTDAKLFRTLTQYGTHPPYPPANTLKRSFRISVSANPRFSARPHEALRLILTAL